MRKPLQVLLDEVERKIVEAKAKEWGMSLAATIRRMIRESQAAVKN